MITVRVPATTANLGSGFDVFGMALSLYDQYQFIKNDHFILEGFLEKYNNDNNLVLLTYKKVFSLYNKDVVPVIIKLEQHIPNCGGLGSSAACIIAAIMGANYFLDNILMKQDILNLATFFENHPDNVTPCLLGGLVGSFLAGDKVISYQYQVSNKIKFLLLSPPFSTNTKMMRKLLPKKINMEDAIFNLGRSSLLSKAMQEGDLENLFYICQDRLHQRYRIKHIPDGEKIMEWCYERKIPCVISGSGGSILIIVDNYEKVKNIPCTWKQDYLTVDYKGAEVL